MSSLFFKNRHAKKSVILAVIIGIYLLAFNPYVLKTARDQYSYLRFFLSGHGPSELAKTVMFGIGRSEIDKSIEGLLQEKELNERNKEKIILSLGGFSLFDSLSQEEKVSYLYEAIHRYPDDPILKCLLRQNLMATPENVFINPDFLIYELEQGEFLDPEEPIFDYLIAYLKRLSFTSAPLREEVIQKGREGTRKIKPPGYGSQMREMAWDFLRNERGIPEVFAVVAGCASINDLETMSQLRELAGYLTWTSGFYLERGEIDKASIAAQTAVDLGRQLEKDKTIIGVLVGQAIEAIGLARLQEVYQQLGDYDHIEEIRIAKMRNHLWGRGIRRHVDYVMKPLVHYFAAFSVSSITSLVLVFWLIAFGLSGLFYYLVKGKSEEEYSILFVRKKTRFILGVGLIIIGCITWVPVGVLSNISLSQPTRLIALFLTLCLYIGLVRVFTPLLIRGELIYRGHNGPRLGAWLVARKALFPLVKWAIIVYLLLIPICGIFIARNSDWFRTTYFDETSFVPFPHVNKSQYYKEVNRLMEIIRNGESYETEVWSEEKTRRDTEAIRYLGRVDAYEAVPELTEILQNTEDEEISDRIINTFGVFSQGVDPHSLESFLNEESTIDTLGRIHHPESSKILLDYAQKVRSLSDVSIEKNIDLALALARQNQFEEASRIMEKIIRTEDEIPYSIGMALGLIPAKELKPLLNQCLAKHDYKYTDEIKEALRKGCDEEMAGKMLQSLISNNKPIPSDLIEILSNHLNQIHIPLLIEGSNEKYQKSLRTFCLYMLGSVKAKEATTVVEQALTDSNWIVRLNAVCALGQLGNSSALSLLKKARQDENLAVQAAAAWSLKEFGGN